MNKTEGMLGLGPRKEGAPPPKDLAAVKEILALLGHTVSQMRLYPAHHSAIAHFGRQLFDKLSRYFQGNGELEFDIQLHAFQWRDEIVYKDENVLRGLPYLFFKDGMKKLAFLHGLDEVELETFLSTVREISLLPVDVGDIVDALWQRDLSHIRYAAPDDYLESKVRVQKLIPAQFESRPEDLYRGRIDLKPEDVAEMFAKMREPDPQAAGEEADYTARFAPLDGSEVQALEDRIAAQRRIEPEKDFLDLALELLIIEERPEVFSAILEFLKKFHQGRLLALDFLHAAQLLSQIDQAAEAVAGKVPNKERALADFKSALREAFPESALRKSVCGQVVTDSESFFLYLSRAGSVALPLGAELASHGPNEDIRSRAVRLLEETGRRDPKALASLAQDSRPEPTRIAIAVFAKIGDPGAIPFLADIVGFRNKSSRLKAIHALSGFPEPAAQKILAGLLEADDMDVRTAAADAVRLQADDPAVIGLMQSAGRTSFHLKAAAAKTALLKALGRSRSAEAVAFLGAMLLKRGLFEKRRIRETRLGAVAALEANGGPEAAEALRTGAKRGSRRIRLACGEALTRLKPGRRPFPGSAS